jgi:hypothetical protein
LDSLLINQGAEGREKKSACDEQIKTGRSNRAAGFSLSRASVPKISCPCGASTLFDESRRRLIICRHLPTKKRGRPLLNPLNYGAKLISLAFIVEIRSLTR